MNVAFAGVQPGAYFIPGYDDALSAAADALRLTINEAVAPKTSAVPNRAEQIAKMLLEALDDGAECNLYPAPDSLARAVAVLRSLPTTVQLPSVVVESDGEVGLDWDEGAQSVLSVSVGESPMLRYAALIGPEPAHGRVPFIGVLPQTLSFFIRRIYSRQSSGA